MPRTSRAVAQRLAAQSKSRKRRVQRAGLSSPAVEERPVQPVAPENSDTVPQASTLTVQPRSAPPPASPRTAVTRRSYADYGAEYSYVWSDLRRIVLVAGPLLALLFGLSFFIR